MSAVGVPADQLDRLHRAYAEDPDPNIATRLVEAYEALAYRIAHRFEHRGESWEDLRQVALLALVSALRTFDPDQGASFSTYAVPTISGALKRHLRDRGWLVRPPRRLQELYLEVHGALEGLEQELGRRPTVAEVADRVGTSEENILGAMEAAGSRHGIALDAPLGPDTDTPLHAVLGKEDDALAVRDDEFTAAQLLRLLPAKERQVIWLSYFDGMTQQEIARQLGKTQTHVSRAMRRALAHLRRLSEADVADRQTVGR